MRRAALGLLAAGSLLAAAAPALSQSRPLPPPGPAPQQLPPPGASKPLPPPGQTQQPEQQPQAAPPAPYQPVMVSAPSPLGDPALDALRKQITEIARRRDRAALGKLVVAKDFFWFGEKGDRADKKRPGVDTLARVLDLNNAKDASGWEALAGFASEPTAMALPDRKDTMCAPSDPVFDVRQFENLVKTTGTDESEWGYPQQPSIDVRSSSQPNSPAIEKLGMHFVRVLEPDGPEPPEGQMPMLRIVTPGGKVGYVPADALSPLGNDQLCYTREASGWKIGGFIGGEQQ